MSVVKNALVYLKLGWSPVPIPAGTKAPVLDDWPSFRVRRTEVGKHFGGATNIGLLTGAASGGLVDVDLDCDEAVALAAEFLPSTPMWSGRTKRPRSHAWYRTRDSVAASAAYKDIDRTTLVELRAG